MARTAVVFPTAVKAQSVCPIPGRPSRVPTIQVRSYHSLAFVADDFGLLSAKNAVEKKDLSVWLSAAEAHGIDPL